MLSNNSKRGKCSNITIFLGLKTNKKKTKKEKKEQEQEEDEKEIMIKNKKMKKQKRKINGSCSGGRRFSFCSKTKLKLYCYENDQE